MARRSVSPVVATLLLILIAVAVALVLYSWVSNLSSGAKSSGAENTGSAIVLEEAKLIRNLTWIKITNSTGTEFNFTNATAVRIWLRNVGSQPIDNGTWSLYVIDSQNGNIVAFSSDWHFDKTLTPGGLYENVTVVFNGYVFNTSVNQYIYLSNATVLSSIDPNKQYIVKIVGPNGVSDAVIVKPIEKEERP